MARFEERGSTTTVAARFALVATSDLAPHPDNPRKHDRAQIRALAKSIKSFGFIAPLVIDRNRKIWAGHGRLEAAKLLGLAEVPVVYLDHLSEAEKTAYMLADNKLTDRSTWHETKVATILRELSVDAIDFDIEATGFELPEIDLRIHSLDDPESTEKADEFGFATGPPVSAPGDLWILGLHKVCCGSALNLSTYESLLEGEKGAAAFTDPPYNVRIDGHVSGKGQVTHREFPMATGEMSVVEFTQFLTGGLTNICRHVVPGAIVYAFMDWRHLAEMHAASRASGCDLLNLCVWVKNNGGMGSQYRSRHELVFVLRNGTEPHVNNVQLGRYGRNRSNVWHYPNVNAFGRDGPALHPTIKPIGLVADAILDSTKRNDIVLDPFIGSGTTLLAGEKTGRRCYGIELDPLYVDTAVERWQKMTGRKAHSRLGETYDQIKARRKAEP